MQRWSLVLIFPLENSGAMKFQKGFLRFKKISSFVMKYPTEKLFWEVVMQLFLLVLIFSS